MPQNPCTFIFKGNVLWGDELRLEPNRRLLVSNGKIGRLLEPDEESPSDVPVMNCSGHTLLPGLIDTHCHLTLPGDGRDVDAFLATSSDEELVRMGLANARQAVRGGVTTLRDLGARAETGFELMRRLARDADPSPRVIVSGPVLTPPRGHGWTFGLQVAEAPAVMAAVQTLHESGAGVIKVMASGGSTPGTEAWSPAMSESELRAAVEEAHNCGLPVAAHVSCPSAAELCLEAGVDDLEHLNLWADADYTNRVPLDLLHRIERRSVFVGPTLQTPYRILNNGADAEDPRRTIRAKLYEDVLDNFRLFANMGLRIIAGSDAGFLVTRFDELHLGLRIMIEQGLPERGAIRAATVEAAAALGLHSTTGCIRTGLEADLVVVEGNPLTTIDALRNVRAVFVGGRAVTLADNPGLRSNDTAIE